VKKLVKRKLVFPAGLLTNFNPAELNGAGLLISQNADGYGVFRAYGKVPGSSRKSWNALAPVVSLHYFEYFDLAGTLRREALELAGGTLYRINDDLSLDTLKSGIVSEPLRSATQFDRIHFCSKHNDPFKWDGSEVLRWGVYAPGQEVVQFQAIDDNTDWTINGANTKADSDIAKNDTGSVQVNKVDATTIEVSLTRTGVAQNILGYSLSAYMWFFIPGAAIGRLRNTSFAAEIQLGDAGLVNADQWQFEVGQLHAGWNLLSIVLVSPSASTGTGADLTAIDTIRLSFFTEQVAATQDGFRWNQFFATDPGYPDVALGGVGAVIGNVSYRVTYLSRNGVESNAGPPSVTITAGGAGNTIELSGIPVSPDPQVLARRIYRDQANDAIWRFVVQIDDNNTTTYSDALSNDARSLTQPPLAASADNDNSPPPRMTEVVEWKGHLCGIDAENPFQFNMSLFNRPDAWPLLYPRQFNDQLVGIRQHVRGLLLFATDAQKLVRGDSFASFVFEDIHPSIGVTGTRAHAETNRQVVGWHDDGLYAFDGFDPWYLSAQILDQVRELPPEEFTDAIVVHDRSRFRVLMFLRSALDGDYDKILTYGYGQLSIGEVSSVGSGVTSHDLRRGVWSSLKLPDSVKPLCAAQVERGADRPELWIGCDDGFVYFLQDPNAIDYAAQTLFEPVDCDIESLPVQLGGDEDVEGRPRYLYVSMVCTNESIWTITVSTLKSADGGVVDSVTFDYTFPAGVSDPKITIPKALIQADYAKVRMRNARLGEDGTILDATLGSIPRFERGEQR
jgi:hypothetical protein